MKGKKPKSRPDADQEVWLHFFGTDVMVDYLDATSKIRAAEERGDKEVSLPTAFLAKWIPQTVRMEDRDIVEAWNQSCDDAGFPDKKLPVPEPPRDPMVLNQDLKEGHALRLKKGQTEAEEDGPF